MNQKALIADQDFQSCVDFQGLVCPGLAIGFRAVKAGRSGCPRNGWKMKG